MTYESKFIISLQSLSVLNDEEKKEVLNIIHERMKDILPEYINVGTVSTDNGFSKGFINEN